MAEQMVMMELLTNECGQDCKGMLREKLKKRIEIVLPIFSAVALFFLCASFSAFYTRRKCLLR